MIEDTIHSQSNIGIIGCGMVATKAHLPALFNNPTESIDEDGFRIIAACNRGEERLNHYKYKLPHIKIFRNYRDLIDSNLCDCLLIATGEENHLEIAQYALDQNLYILMEKPVSKSVEQIENFINDNKNKFNKIQIGFNKRFYPGFLKFTEFKSNNTLSDIIGGSSFFSTSHGKGGILSNLIHQCDLICWIFGIPVDIKSHFSKIINNEKIGKTISASILTNTGAAVSLFYTSSSNWGTPYNETIEILDSQKNRLSIRNSNEVIFSKFIDIANSKNYIYNQTNSVFWKPDLLGFKTQISQFYKLVIGKIETASPNLIDGLIAQRLYEKILSFDDK